MKTITTILSLGLLLLLLQSDVADASGRYQRGRTLYRRSCAACLPMGWDWAPTLTDLTKRPPLRVMAKGWSSAKICTWLHKRTRKTTGPACYPGRIRGRDRLDILYYLYRRARGDLKRPVLHRNLRLPLYKGPTFKSRMKARRRTALNRHKNTLLLRKMRKRSRRRTGPRRGQVVRPRLPAKRTPTRTRNRRAPAKGRR